VAAFGHDVTHGGHQEGEEAADRQTRDRRSAYASVRWGQFVGIRRWIPESDHLDGFVVAQSERWVLLARLSDRITLDGWTAVRVRDVQSVALDPAGDCFEIKALKARGQWPPNAPESVDITTVSAILRSVSAGGWLTAIFREFERPDVTWIGDVRTVANSAVSLLEVSVAGGWARRPRRFDLDDLTRIDFGGGYEEALSLVAGPPPKPRAR
jgi:hypothetical protein